MIVKAIRYRGQADAQIGPRDRYGLDLLRLAGEPVVAAALLLTLRSFSAQGTLWGQQQDTPATDTEVFAFGKEQEIVDAMTGKSGGPASQEYSNELDHIFAVLLARAYPKPQARDLARATVNAICQELETITQKKASDSQHTAWLAMATQTESFESVLKDLLALATAEGQRERLVGAGLAAMLRATGSKSAGVLSVAEAEQITKMIEARATRTEVCGASAAERVRARVVDHGIFYVQIPTLEDSGIARSVNDLIRKNVTDALSSVILDLRDNPGGRAEEANALADIFLDEVCLQIFQFRSGKRIAFRSKPGALDVRVFILTNRNTASAAEMLAIALHDNRRATLIGQPTGGVLFGKDFEKLGDGRMVAFRSEPTVLSPTGRDYAETGLPPDIVIDEPRNRREDPALDRAVELARTHAGKGTRTSTGGRSL